MKDSLLELKNLSKNYYHKKNIYTKNQTIEAVRDVSFNVHPLHSLGLIGESGCGKSSIANMILRLIEPTNGNIFFKGEEITKFSEKKMQKYRKDIQIIFQHSNAVLDPQMTIESC